MLSIDFGTSRVKVAYLKGNEAKLLPIGEGSRNFIPSLFYIGTDGSIEIGDDAASMLDVDPNGVVDTLKRKLRERKIRKNKQRKTPKELLKTLFSWIRIRCHEEMEHIFPEPPNEVILTYPARYTDVEMNLLKEAAYEVGFETVELISEPEAAGLAYQHKVGTGLSSDVVVILDCGGGTADWAGLKMNNGKLRLFPEAPGNGDENISGHDIDEELLSIVRDKLEDEEKDDAL